MKLRDYIKLVSEEEIARKYFIMNSFDGALTILGILLGMYAASVTDSRVVIVSCVGASVAMAVSGIWGAYATEHAERTRELRRLERYMLKDLGETRISRNAQMMSLIVALVNGVTPLIVSILLIMPFIAAQLGALATSEAYYASLGLILVLLFLLGAFVGKIGKENAIKSGAKMMLAGLVVAAFIFVLEGLSVV